MSDFFTFLNIVEEDSWIQILCVVIHVLAECEDYDRFVFTVSNDCGQRVLKRLDSISEIAFIEQLVQLTVMLNLKCIRVARRAINHVQVDCVLIL